MARQHTIRCSFLSMSLIPLSSSSLMRLSRLYVIMNSRLGVGRGGRLSQLMAPRYNYSATVMQRNELPMDEDVEPTCASQLAGKGYARDSIEIDSRMSKCRSCSSSVLVGGSWRALISWMMS